MSLPAVSLVGGRFGGRGLGLTLLYRSERQLYWLTTLLGLIQVHR